MFNPKIVKQSSPTRKNKIWRHLTSHHLLLKKKSETTNNITCDKYTNLPPTLQTIPMFHLACIWYKKNKKIYIIIHEIHILKNNSSNSIVDSYEEIFRVSCNHYGCILHLKGFLLYCNTKNTKIYYYTWANNHPQFLTRSMFTFI